VIRKTLRVLAAHLGASLFFMLALPAPGNAQIGATTDIITGTVKAENAQPIKDATIEVTSLETSVTRRARTNAQGRYTILFPDGGGEYRVVIRAIGLAPATSEIRRVADEDRLVADATLTQNVTRLSTVAVEARQAPRGGQDLPTPGSIERAFTPEQVARLPIDASDLLNLVLLSPQIVAIGGSDTSAAGFSVGGLRPEANAVTLDGLSFGSTEVPSEAMRSTRVITSTYDVTRGQFSGGQIASTTRSGTNAAQGNFSYSLRDDELVLTGDEESPLAQGYTQNQFSGGFGRSIVKDRFFGFVSTQLRRREDILPSLFNADAGTLARFGVSPDSVQRFFAIAGANGMPPGQFFNENRVQDNVSGLGRFDWLLDNGHSLSVRADWRWSDQDPSRVGTLSLPMTGGTNKGWGGGVMATYTSIFGGMFLNEFKGYVSVNKNQARSFSALPAGRVQIASDLDDATTRAVSTLAFGGNTGLPQDGRSSTFEMTDEVSWLTTDHRFKLGGLFNVSGFEQDVTSNRFGTYTFASLADYEAGKATSFTRTLQPNVREGSQLNAALYLGDVWRARRGLQVTYGARLEGGRFGREPAYNPVVEASFDRRTDFIPSEVHVSPRLGFTWTVGAPGGGPGAGRGGRGGGGGGAPAGGRGGGGGLAGAFGGRGGGANPTIIRGGLGEFRSTVSSNLFSQAASATGLANSETQLVCTGDAVPQPDWDNFLFNPSTIPTMCVDGGNSFVPRARPAVTVFDRNFQAPRSWRGSLGVQRRMFDRYNLNIDASYTRGVAQTGYTDLNLNPTPQFLLANEADRPVFVPATTIVAASGVTNMLASRRDSAFAQVFSVGSDLASTAKQLTMSLQGLTTRGAIFNVGYTLGYAEDQSSGGSFGGFGGGFGRGGGAGGGGGSFGSATTAGNPNVREWAVSSYDRRHSITGSLTWPINLGLEVTATGRVASGAPFTPLVGSDINGDGSRNDRAFIFDPSSPSTDPAVAAAMTKLIDNSPEGVQQCLTSQLGGAASRNSCRGVWQPSLELQMNWRPQLFGLNRRLMVSLNTQNLLGGLDELFHGRNNLHGWGAVRSQDNTLLYARGFDPVSNKYLYEVNERFGASRQGANGISIPFQVGVNARLMLGPDRARDAIDAVRGAAFGGGRGGRGGGAGGAGGPGLAGMATALANFNPVMQILTLRDTLKLSTEQVTKLQVVADSLNAKNMESAQVVMKDVESAGANPDMAALNARLRPVLEKVQGNQQAALREARAILSAEQWQRLPPRIRNGRAGGPGRGG
jgi:hypothetical protein